MRNMIKWSNILLKNYSFNAKIVKEGDENSEELFVKDIYLNYASSNEKADAIVTKLSAQCALYTRDLANTRGSEATPYFLHKNLKKFTINFLSQYLKK